MTTAPVEPTKRPTPVALGESSLAVEKGTLPNGFDPQAMFANSAFGSAGQAPRVQELMQAYQAMARRNGEKLTTSMQALAAVKTPTEFFALQRQLLTESVAAAVSDSATIGKLTTAAFTAAFEPMRKQVEKLQSKLKT